MKQIRPCGLDDVMVMGKQQVKQGKEVLEMCHLDDFVSFLYENVT